MITPGEYPLVYTTGYSAIEEFIFYNGTQQTGTPFDFGGKTVILEVKDPKRNRVIKTYTLAIEANKATWSVNSLDIEPGQYTYRVALAYAGKKDIYVVGKFIVNV
jgi:hypothetical protein